MHGHVARSIFAAGIVIAMLSCSAPKSAPYEPSLELYQSVHRRVTHWRFHERLAREMSRSAVWTTHGPSNWLEWESLIRFALAFQEMDPQDVEITLAVYMVLIDESDLNAKIAAWSRPMLILRLMFDIPEDYLPTLDDQIIVGTGACGGLASTLPSRVMEDPYPLTMPVFWDDDGPVLRAFSVEVGGMRGEPYNPLPEYRYFLDHFPHRQGLQAFVSTPVRDWRSILHPGR